MKLRKIVKKIIRSISSKDTHEHKDVLIRFTGTSTATVTTKSHQSILKIAAMNDIDIPHYCGGSCRCGTCVVEIVSDPDNLSKPSGNEIMVLGIDKSQKGHRLACQAIVYDNVQISIPEWF